MTENSATDQTTAGPGNPIVAGRKGGRAFIILGAIILATYAPVLWALLLLAWKNDLQQHIILIPFIAIYLWRNKVVGSQPGPSARPSVLPATFSALLAISAGGAGWFLRDSGVISHNDALSLAAFSLLTLLLSAALAALGWRVLRPHVFAICLLAFAIPLPDFAVHGASLFLQYPSADAADLLLRLSGTSFSRDGLEFRSPTVSFVVAEECSGIRSTFVLFITSLIVGNLFLSRRRNRVFFLASILPLAILRNGFRIASIAWLSANVDIRFLDSPLHHRGGPIFFALSLVPFFLLLLWLRRSEQRVVPPPEIPRKTS